MKLPPGLYPSSHHHNLVLNSTTVSSNMSTSNSSVSAGKDTITVSPLFLSTRASKNTQTCDDGQEQHEEDCSNGESNHQQEHTLELFPLRKEGFCSNGEKEKESGIHCFYEFLPLKN